MNTQSKRRAMGGRVGRESGEWHFGITVINTNMEGNSRCFEILDSRFSNSYKTRKDGRQSLAGFHLPLSL